MEYKGKGIKKTTTTTTKIKAKQEIKKMKYKHNMMHLVTESVIHHHAIIGSH